MLLVIALAATAIALFLLLPKEAEAAVGAATVSVSPTERFTAAQYTLAIPNSTSATFNAADTLTIAFPVGTHVPDTDIPAGQITVEGTATDAVAATTPSSRTLVITAPAGMAQVATSASIDVVIAVGAGIRNPGTLPTTTPTLSVEGSNDTGVTTSSAYSTPITSTAAATIIVDDDLVVAGAAFDTIQGAINASLALDTISVAAGTYAETVSIDKALTLQGVGDTSLIQAPSGHSVEVRASDITVDDFKIVGSTTGSAIRFLGNIIHDGITISNNTLEGVGSQTVVWTCGTASGCQQTTDLTVTLNTITTGNPGGSGLQTAGASNPPHSGWTVSNNTFSSPFTGVNLELRDVHNVTVDGNTFGATDGANVIISSDASNLTLPIVFSNNTVSGNTNGSMVAFLDDFSPIDAANTTIDDVTISGNTFDNWGNSNAVVIGFEEITSVTVSQNDFLKTGVGVKALTNLNDTATVIAVDNFWGKASGPGGTVGVGAGGEVVEDTGTVTFRPWLLEAGGATFDETIVLLSVPGDWTLFSAPQLLSATPTVKDDAAGTVSMLAFVNGAFISPGATFDADVVKPVSAFYVKATNLAGIGFNFALPSSPGQTSKALIAGWNLIGTNSQALAKDELSSIQNTPQVGGILTLFVPDTFNDSARKDKGHIDWVGDGDHDLNANPITALPATNLSKLDGYWAFLNVARTFSKQLILP
ncbi:MAG: hypothetical protein V3U79_05050 [Dehalococcoidia bacterium]